MPNDTNINQLIINKLTQQQFDSASGDENELWLVEDDAEYALKSDIPTESTVSGWGFTKNTGTYSKPSTGIPKTDLASAVQTSLGKADSAIQSIKTINNESIVGTGNIELSSKPKDGLIDLPAFAAAGSKVIEIRDSIGITANSILILDVATSLTAATAAEQIRAWSHIYSVQTGTNKLTFYSDGATSTAIDIKMLWW